MDVKLWPKHLYALDVSRGLAALAVVLWHWQHFFYENNSISTDFSRESQPLYPLLKLFYEEGSKGVEYFFLLSGFVFFWLSHDKILKREVSAKKFFIQRFSRLYPLHLVTLMIVATLQYYYVSINAESFVYPNNDAFHFILNLGFASHWGLQNGWSFNGPIWSVSIEILLYIIFFITALCRIGGMLFTACISIVSFVILYFNQLPIMKGLALFYCGGWVFYITVQILSRYQWLKSPIYYLALISWCSVLVSVYAYDLSNYIMDLGNLGKVFITSFPSYVLFPLTVCSLAMLEADGRISMKSLSWIGNITYSSYLLHFPLQLSVAILISFGVLSSSIYYSPEFLLIFFVVLILLSQMSYKYFEIPTQKYIRNLS